MGQQRKTYTDDFKAAAVDRLYEPGATQGSVSKELGITGTQLKTWRLEIEAFGSAEAKRRQKADACVFRGHPATCTDSIRPPIPI